MMLLVFAGYVYLQQLIVLLINIVIIIITIITSSNVFFSNSEFAVNIEI